MVHESDTAWHAGVVSPNSILANKGNPNSFVLALNFLGIKLMIILCQMSKYHQV
jgi:hypothetical protein